MEELKTKCVNRLTKILPQRDLDANVLKVIASFLYHTNTHVGSILCDIGHFISENLWFTRSDKLFVVTRRTKYHLYIRELTQESVYRSRFRNQLGEMIRVKTTPYDHVDRVEIYTPDERTRIHIFVPLAENMKTLILPKWAVDQEEVIKRRYKYLALFFC